MFNRNAKYHDWLVPYLEGGLDAARSEEIGARLAADPALALEAERLKEMLGHLRESAARQPATDTARVPADLWPRLHARLEPVPVRRRTTTLGWAAAAGAAAMAWAALWLPTLHAPERNPVSVTHPVKVVAVPKQTDAPRISPAVPSRPPIAPSVSPAKQASLPHVPAPPASPVRAVKQAPDRVAALPLPAAPRASRLLAPAFPLSGALPPAALSKKSANKPTLMASNGAVIGDGDRVADTNGLGLNHGLKAAMVTPPASDAAVPMMAESAPPAPLPAPADAPETKNSILNGAPVTAGKHDVLRPDALPSHPDASGTASPPGAAAAPKMVGGGGGFGGGAGGGFRGRAFARAFDANNAPALDAWQTTLSQAQSPPLLGDDLGTQQANGALTAAREAGQMEALRVRLEAKRAQAPNDIVTARTLAAIYDFTARRDLALQERRRLTGLTGAVGEDWFALALAEDQAGNKQAARAAYRRAVDAPAPLSSQHAALARQRE